MTVIKTQELPDKRGGGEDDKGSRTYTRVFLVETDNKNDGVETVLNAEGLPAFNAFYQTATEVNMLALANRRTPRQMTGSRTTWTVTISYSTKRPDGEEREDTDNEAPLDRPPVISYSVETEQVIPPGAFESPNEPDAGLGLKNSAGELFDPAPTITQSWPVVTITRNEAVFPTTNAFHFVDSVNSVQFGGFAEKQVQMRSITTPGIQVETLASGERVKYYPVSYTLAFRESFQLKLIDQGSFFWTGSSRGDGEKKPFEAAGKQFIGNLDGTGLALAEASSAEFLTFDVYPVRNFEEIHPPLPQDFNE